MDSDRHDSKSWNTVDAMQEALSPIRGRIPLTRGHARWGNNIQLMKKMIVLMQGYLPMQQTGLERARDFYCEARTFSSPMPQEGSIM